MLERQEVAREDTWDETAVYRSLDDWEEAFAAIQPRAEEITRFRGSLGQSAATLREALELYYAQYRELEKLHTYAKLLSDVDIANSENLGHVQRTLNLASRMRTAASFLKPEILSIDPRRLEELMQDQQLADYRRALEVLIRHRPHTLSNDEERLLALGELALGAPDKIYTQLCNADMDFGSVKVSGEERALTHASYGVLIKHPERRVREETQTKYYAQYAQYKNTIAAALTGSYQKDVFLARAKNFSSCMARGIFDDNVSPDVYLNLIETVSKNLHSLHRYYKLRKRVLKLETQRLFDTYVPLVAEVDLTIPYKEAVSYIEKSLSPLGSEYTDVLRGGLTKWRWVDRYENKGKRSGAYSGGCYDSPPYILISYKEDDIRSMFTLAHEAGHSLHTYYSNRAQPYQYHSYSIFVAEVASTFNEALLSEHLQEKWKDDKSVLMYLINQQIDDIKATLHRQTMFAEFELKAHNIIEADKPLTIDVFSGIYRELLLKYFGDSVEIAGDDHLEFLRIPHFYWPFYVYKYATGISAALALAKRVKNGGSSERSDYLSFLSSGSSKDPLDALKDAGVDMASPEPIEQALARFAELVERLENLLPA